MGINSALGSSALLPAGLGFRNKIINGDMRIAQRGTATITGSSSVQYPVDRWAVYNGTGTVTFAQSTDAPAGFNASLNATVTATGSYSTSGYTQITHKIEGFNCQDLAYGTSSAKTVVLSFWSKSSVVGTQNVSFKNSGNNRVYVATYTIDAANTWEKKIVTVVGDTTGTWLVDSGIGLEVTFNLGMGTTYDVTAGSWQAAAAKYSTSGAIDFAANSGATFYITGLQLEQNLQPTPFEQRPFSVELNLCKRYYETTYNYGTPAGTATSDGAFYHGGISDGSGYVYLTTMLSTPKRVEVAAGQSGSYGVKFYTTGGTVNQALYIRSATSGASTTLGVNVPSRILLCVYMQVGATWVPTLVYFHYVYDVEL